MYPTAGVFTREEVIPVEQIHFFLQIIPPLHNSRWIFDERSATGPSLGYF